MPNIIFLDASTVDYGLINLNKLKNLGHYSSYAITKPNQVKSRLKNADIVITNKAILNKETLESTKNLKLICVAATGYNNVDVVTAKKLGISVCNSRDYSTQSVAEHTITLLLALSHRLIPHHLAVINKNWSKSKTFNLTSFPYSNLKNKTLGIVGYGAIGKQVKKMAKALGLNVMIAKIPGRKYKTSNLKRHPLAQVFKKSDYISLNAPLSKQTFHLMNHNSLKQMKPSACVINMARGPLVDETAMAIALMDNVIAGYATDVMEHEPPPQDHVFFDKALKNKIIITPHIAWTSLESRQNLVDDMVLNIQAFLKNKKRNIVS